MQYPDKRAVLEDIFGRVTTAVIDLPSSLSAFLSKLPPSRSYILDDFINDYTLLPLYRPFMKSEQYQRCYEAMASSEKGAARVANAVLRASRIPQLLSLRFCPQCVEYDRQHYDECYWHRVHQVPGVETCPQHQVFLEESHAPTPRFTNRINLFAAEDVLDLPPPPRPLDLSNPLHVVLHAIAVEVAWLLSYRGPVLDLDELRERYIVLLFERKLAGFRRVTQVREFFAAFRQHFPESLFQRLNCEFANTSNNWLIRLMHSADHTLNPIYHLLLIQFLGHTVQSLLNLPADSHPFGPGPWPCLNPHCQHYQMNVIDRCEMTYDDGQPIGAFICICGFVYKQKRSREITNVGKRPYIRAYGSIWEAALQQIWLDPTLSLIQKLKRMQITQRTFIRQGIRLGLPFPIPGTQRNICKRSVPRQRKNGINSTTHDSYRSVWLEAMKVYPTATYKELRDMYSATYNWLVVHDGLWLSNHRPKLALRPAPRKRWVDWDERDQRLAAHIKRRAMELHRLPGRPRKIKIATLLQGSDGQRFMSQLDKLPLTAEALKMTRETPEAFAIRKIHWVVAEAQTNSTKLTRSKLIQAANVADHMHHPDVIATVEAMLIVVAR
jgi:hypothetical protein